MKYPIVEMRPLAKAGEAVYLGFTRVYPNGVIEVTEGYDPRKVALATWNRVEKYDSSLVFFPDERGVGLVTFHRDGKPTYREGYTPDPVARELWEAIAKADPGQHAPDPEPEVDGTKLNPGFTGLWGAHSNIDCFRPR